MQKTSPPVAKWGHCRGVDVLAVEGREELCKVNGGVRVLALHMLYVFFEV